jgi:hypothetical protein
VLIDVLRSFSQTLRAKNRLVKSIPVTGNGGPQGCETSRLPHFLNNRLTDDGEVARFRAGRPLPPGRILVLISLRG